MAIWRKTDLISSKQNRIIRGVKANVTKKKAFHNLKQALLPTHTHMCAHTQFLASAPLCSPFTNHYNDVHL